MTDFQDAAPANGARGEAVLDIEGEEAKLCLTLGALAEMETEFRVTGIRALRERLMDMSARDLLTVLSILIRAGGSMALTVRDLMRRRLDPLRVARAVAAAFARAGVEEAHLRQDPKPTGDER